MVDNNVSPHNILPSLYSYLSAHSWALISLKITNLGFYGPVIRWPCVFCLAAQR